MKPSDLATRAGMSRCLRHLIETSISDDGEGPYYDPDRHLLNLTCVGMDLLAIVGEADPENTSPLELKELFGAAAQLTEAIFYAEQIEGKPQ